MLIGNTEVVTRGRLLKTARVRDEWYDFVTEPVAFLDLIRKSEINPDFFTFLGELPDRTAKYPYYHEWENAAVLSISTYDHWWKSQISDKTRNMARKAVKKGIEIRVVPFDDDFVRGIMGINNESPVRQGKPFWHYGKDFETTKSLNITFKETTQYIGAYLGDELIGYIKLVHGNGKASLMQILSKMSHRDKAPTNALMAKAVELCAEKQTPYLHYALWCRGGLGEFKKNHGFEPFNVPRYFVPMSGKGKIALQCRLHHKWSYYFPQTWRNKLVDLRSKWYATKFKSQPN